MSDVSLKAIAAALAVYAGASLCMSVALFIGLHAVSGEWALDMPAMYVLQLAALGMGVVCAGYYYRLSGVAAWFTVAGGSGLVVIFLLMVMRDPATFLVLVVTGGVLALSLLWWLSRLGPSETARLPGDPVTPSVESSFVGHGWELAAGVAAMIALAPVAIVLYVLSPEGRADAPLVVALIVGPIVGVGLAWYGYRRWYRRRYPEE